MEKAKGDKKAPAIKLPRGQKKVKKSSKDDDGASSGDILASATSNRTDEHPLLNPMLVSKIIALVNPDFESFRQLRLVCKTWHDATLHQWRKTAVLRIVPDATPFNGKRYNGISFLECTQELQGLPSPVQILQKPFSKYKLIGFDINIIVCEDPLTPANQFWTVYGPLMDYIHLDNCTIRDTRHRPLAQLLVRHVPNATELVLSRVKLMDEVKPPQKRRSFKEIHPKLKTLTVYGNNRMGLCGLMKLAPQLETIRGYDLPNNRMGYHSLVHSIYSAKAFNTKSPQSTAQLLSQLKHIDLLHSSALMKFQFSDIMELGHDTKLQLETLAVQLSPSPFATTMGLGPPILDGNIDQFLKSLSGTLKTLTVFRAPLDRPFTSFLCQEEMTALTELHMLGTVAPDFEFLQFTPNLKKLCIDLACFEQRDVVKELVRRGDHRVKYRKNKTDMARPVYWMGNSGLRVLQLKHLEIDHLFRDSESWELLGKFMPNLKTLKTIVNSRILPLINEQWKGLTELVCLHGSSLINSDFFTEENKFSTRKSVKNISDFKDLRTFQLDAFCGESKLSDSSVLKGLLKMPSLKRVQICVNHKMTVKAENALKNGIEFCRVIRNYAEPGGNHADYDCCARFAFEAEARLGLRHAVAGIIENNESEESDTD